MNWHPKDNEVRSSGWTRIPEEEGDEGDAE